MAFTPHSDGGRDLQDCRADTDSCLTDSALALTPILERGAISFVVWNIPFLCTLFDAVAVPHGDCYKRSEPEYGIQSVDGKEGIRVGKSLRTRPHGDHD